MTISQLKELKLRYRGNSIIYALLSTIIGECEQISKEPSSDDIIKVMMKIYKDNCATILECEKYPNKIIDLKEENKFIISYLPKKLTEKELTAIIYSQISNGFKMAEIMKYLSSNYKSKYDGKQAVQIIKSLEDVD